MLQRGEIDVVVTDLSFSVERRRVVEHLKPLFYYSHSLLYARPESKISWDHYSNAFAPGFWAALAGTSAALAFSVWFWSKKSDGESAMTWAGATCYVAACLTCRELDQSVARAARSASLRVLLLTLLLCSSLAFALYNAVLVSFLAATDENFPYNKIDDVTESNLGVTIPVGTYLEELLEKSDPRKTVGRLYSTKLGQGKVKKVSWFQTAEDKMADMRAGFVHIADSLTMFSLQEYVCDVVDITSLRSQSGLALPAGSRMTGLFNHRLHKMEESGLIDRFKQRYFPQATSPRLADCSDRDHDLSLGYKSVMLCFAVVAGGTTAAVTLGVAEWATDKFKTRR